MNDVHAPKTLQLPFADHLIFAILGAVSGSLSAVLFFMNPITRTLFESGGILVGPGLLFGLAAMIPFRGVVPYWWPKAMLSALVCAVAHALAMLLATDRRLLGPDPGPWFMGPGALGALIAGKGLLVVVGRPWRYRTLAAMVAAGAIAGASFPLVVFGVYPIWQAAVAAPLGGLLADLGAFRAGQASGPGQGVPGRFPAGSGTPARP